MELKSRISPHHFPCCIFVPAHPTDAWVQQIYRHQQRFAHKTKKQKSPPSSIPRPLVQLRVRTYMQVQSSRLSNESSHHTLSAFPRCPITFQFSHGSNDRHAAVFSACNGAAAPRDRPAANVPLQRVPALHADAVPYGFARKPGRHASRASLLRADGAAASFVSPPSGCLAAVVASRWRCWDCKRRCTACAFAQKWLEIGWGAWNAVDRWQRARSCCCVCDGWQRWTLRSSRQ
jgi:hypothetical protein